MLCCIKRYVIIYDLRIYFVGFIPKYCGPTTVNANGLFKFWERARVSTGRLKNRVIIMCTIYKLG